MNNRLFFDTNVLQTVIAEGCVDRVRRYTKQNYRYVVSPMTTNELLLGVANGDPLYFPKDQARASVLRGSEPFTMLALPGAFALKQLLNKPVKSPNDEKGGFKQCLKILLEAESKDQLARFEVGPKKRRLNFDALQARHNAGKGEHARILEALRSGELREPNQHQWVQTSFRNFGVVLEDEQWSKLGSALDAAFALNRFLCRQARQNTYDFAEHDSDWVDIQQLFYLSAPDVHMVTTDKRLRERVGATHGASRIILLRDFITMAS